MTLTSFPGIREHEDRMAHIAKDHWRKYESYQEHADRVDQASSDASWYFGAATKAQTAAYKRAMEDLRGITGPRWDRAREAAKAVWYASTEQARNLLERTFNDLMATGEIDETTSDLWDELAVEASRREAA